MNECVIIIILQKLSDYHIRRASSSSIFIVYKITLNFDYLLFVTRQISYLLSLIQVKLFIQRMTFQKMVQFSWKKRNKKNSIYNNEFKKK